MKRNLIISMTDSNYFKYGHELMRTRRRVDADFICYSPDLTQSQRNLLIKYCITLKKVRPERWKAWMQSLKFQFIADNIYPVGKYDGITFIDWDTLIIKDWGDIFKGAKWDLGITVRNEYIRNNKMYRAWANGGVIFARNTAKSRRLCHLALGIIEAGNFPKLPEYDFIWKTLEIGRKPEKTHYRTNHRWWCDQVLLSALVMSKKRLGFNIKLFDCKQYNNIWKERSDTYILHLKDKSGASSKLKDG